MNYLAVCNLAYSTASVSGFGAGDIEFWFVAAGVDTIQKVSIFAVDASHALQIVETQVLGIPVVGFDTLPDGNLRVMFSSNPFEYYLFTGW